MAADFFLGESLVGDSPMKKSAAMGTSSVWKWTTTLCCVCLPFNGAARRRCGGVARGPTGEVGSPWSV